MQTDYRTEMNELSAQKRNSTLREETTTRSQNEVQKNNFMEVSETQERRGVTTDRFGESGNKSSPNSGKKGGLDYINETETLQVQHNARLSNEFKTKSGMKASHAIQETTEVHEKISTYEDQRNAVDFHPSGPAVDQEILDEDDEAVDMVNSNTIPSAATRPSLPEMDSSPSVKGRMNVADLQPRTKQFSDINQKLSL